jgi:hypothetical protein
MSSSDSGGESHQPAILSRPAFALSERILPINARAGAVNQCRRYAVGKLNDIGQRRIIA